LPAIISVDGSIDAMEFQSAVEPGLTMKPWSRQPKISDDLLSFIFPATERG
jgi:hypothetical protein